jgi:transcription elongation GreA/GreB family factor
LHRGLCTFKPFGLNLRFKFKLQKLKHPHRRVAVFTASALLHGSGPRKLRAYTLEQRVGLVNKQALIKKIIAQLQGELELYFKAAKAAHAEATHEQSKAESKYDTRGLEASYLARGQSKQAAETAQAIEEFQVLPARTFTVDDAIDVGALVELKSKSETASYFIGPRAGGTEIIYEKKDVLVITPSSPLGQQLVGRKQGEKVQLAIAGNTSEFKIISVV